MKYEYQQKQKAKAAKFYLEIQAWVFDDANAGKSQKEAAQHFKCTERTIQKALAYIPEKK